MNNQKIEYQPTSNNPMGSYRAVSLQNSSVLHYSRFINANSTVGEEIMEILSESAVAQLVTKGFVAKFGIKDADIQAPCRLTATTHRIDVEALPYSAHATDAQFRIEPGVLSYFTRRQCALAWLAINTQLAKCSSSLFDAHLANFAFDHSLNPKWIDIDSFKRIVHAADGLEEFRSAQARPLIAMKLSGDLAPYLRKSKSMSASGLRALTHIPTLSLKGVELSSALLGFLNRKFGLKFTPLRGLFLKVSRLLIPLGSLGPKGVWSDYRQKNPYGLDPADERESLILRVTSGLNFHTVSDLGGNDGRFLWLVSRGREVRGTLYDTDDWAVSRFCRHVFFMQKSAGVEKDSAALAGFVMSVGEVQASHDLVLALALTHHLALGQAWGFSRIAKHLARLSLKYVLVEFMPAGVGAVPEWYSLENFKVALHEEFSEVQVIEDSVGTGRVLILATK